MLPVIAGISGPELTPQERELFAELQPAGYILFSRNIIDYELTRELTDELRRLTTDGLEPIIAIDQEGGRVVRTADIGVHLPSAADLSALGNQNLIAQAAFYCSRALHTLGVNTNFAPVLDIASPHANALPSRCWGADSQTVTSHAGVWNRCMAHQGVMTCGKHFPGMGAADCDPHFDLPVLHGTRESFLEEATIPFMALMPELPSLMIAHLLVPEMDADLPTSLSPEMVQGFLRTQLGYDGVVFTDDLCMGAITGRYQPAESAPLALRAGCDLPLICHDCMQHLPAVAKSIAALPEEVLEAPLRRIQMFRSLLTRVAPMTFLEWDGYLRDVKAFCARIPSATTAQPGSPVQDY